MDYSSVSVSERRFLPPAVAVSTVAFALRPPPGAHLGDTVAGTPAVSEPRVPGAPNSEAPDSETLISDAVLWIPLVRRTRPPFAGCWALPGGPIPWDETLVDTALRTLRAAVLRDPGYLEQLYSFGSIERSADAQRLVTISYWALYGEDELAAPAAPDAAAAAAAPDANVAWFAADRLPDLAFDHAEIVDYALWRLRLKTEYQAVAHRFLGPTFTIAQLRAVREAILGEPVDPANFRRQVLAQGRLIDTGHTQTGGRHRPARLYRFADEPDPAPAPAMT